jgi:cytidyltransferase-like protein
MSIACVSGYFDPIHVGHIEYFKLSKNVADKLMVIVNNDEQAILKKGKAFMPADERVKLIQELKCVDYCYVSDSYTAENVIKCLSPTLSLSVF